MSTEKKLYEFFFYNEDCKSGHIFVVAKSYSSALKMAKDKLRVEGYEYESLSKSHLIADTLKIHDDEDEQVYEVIYPS